MLFKWINGLVNGLLCGSSDITGISWLKFGGYFISSDNYKVDTGLGKWTARERICHKWKKIRHAC